jgi:hypothetical protein
MECRHLEGDPADNRVGMIAWGTPRQNIMDLVDHGTHVQARKTHCAQGHPYDDQNTAFTRRQRRCRTCMAQWQREKRARRRAKEV